MGKVKEAFQGTSSHGLPRIVSSKPVYVRIAWLLVFLLMLALFLKGFSEFVVKLRSNQVTTTLDAKSVRFQFPDAYVCFENPISASYSASMTASTAAAINAGLNSSAETIRQYTEKHSFLEPSSTKQQNFLSMFFPQSLPYHLLVDAVAHRTEQAVIESGAAYYQDDGLPITRPVALRNFYHPASLRCVKWILDDDLQSKILESGSSSGLVATVLVDTVSFSDVAKFTTDVYVNNISVPLSEWPLSVQEITNLDRRAGVRVFLTAPGEYPSDIVTSFSLGPGKHHTVEIDMTQQVRKVGQFDCVSDQPDVQFVNPYDQSPYSHAYSYSYCYYYEYHRRFQLLLNISGQDGPLPWSLRGTKYYLNVSGEPNILSLASSKLSSTVGRIVEQATTLCEATRPCSTLDYRVSISSAGWPTQSSLAPFVSSSIKHSWTKAKARNLSVPALDFLLTGNASSVASYVRSNLLKVHFKPHRVLCDRVTFSRDYGASNFISDVGGIMGIYLGMSLLTLCELFELLFDIASSRNGDRKTSPTLEGSPDSGTHETTSQ